MKRVRIGIWGAGSLTEQGILPTLSRPDALALGETGTGWARRPASEGDIRYQPAFTPEIVALCDEDEGRLTRVGESWRLRARYTDPRTMLREVAPDVLLVAPTPTTITALPDFLRFVAAKYPAIHVWVAGPPAPNEEEVTLLYHDLSGRGGSLHFADTLSQGFALRTAHAAILQNEIGPVAALTLRWGTPFPDGASAESVRRFVGAYAALNLLLRVAHWKPRIKNGSSPHAGFAGDEEMFDDVSARPAIVAAQTREGATSLWVRCDNGVGMTTLFAGADAWSAALPRLEIVGTEGRYLVCEGLRQITLHVPGKPAQLHGAPFAALAPSTPELAGVAGELRYFLNRWALSRDEGGGDSLSPRGIETAVQSLRLLEAAREAIRSEELVSIGTPNGTRSGPRPTIEEPPAAAEPALRLTPNERPATPRASRAALAASDAPTLPL